MRPERVVGIFLFLALAGRGPSALSGAIHPSADKSVCGFVNHPQEEPS